MKGFSRPAVLAVSFIYLLGWLYALGVIPAILTVFRAPVNAQTKDLESFTALALFF